MEINAKNLTKKISVKLFKFLIKVAMVLIIVIFVLVANACESLTINSLNSLTHPAIKPIYSFPQNYGMKNYENVKFEAADGVLLKGWLIRNGNSKKTIIISHGYGGNRTNFLLGSKIYLQKGFNVLLYDFRGHGESQRALVTIGYKETKDLLGAIRFVKQSGIGSEIGLAGFSMGAVTSIDVLAKTHSVKFVIADSPFSDLQTYLVSNISKWIHLPHVVFSVFINLNMKYIYGIEVNNVSPIKVISKTNVPIMLIHGNMDTVIPYSASTSLIKKARNKLSRLDIFNGAGHISSYSVNKYKYTKDVYNFIDSVEK